MKWIKLFESFEDDEYYREIDTEDAFKRLNNIVDMPISEMDVISKIFGESYKINIDHFLVISDTGSERFVIATFTHTYRNIKIYKLEDDYYIVHDSYISNVSGDEMFLYVCDQMDGLRKLLEKTLNETPKNI